MTRVFFCRLVDNVLVQQQFEQHHAARMPYITRIYHVPRKMAFIGSVSQIDQISED